MSLFQKSVVKKYLKGIELAKVDQAWLKFTNHFHNKVIQENIRNSKEEQYQGEFLIDLFVNVLGYTKNPTPNFNLTTELKNVKGAKKTDGAILKDEKALAVIELKGMNTTDLGKVETQAFGYKNNQPGCVYVITSNFEKLRFYIDNAVDFEEFNLFQLTRERFEVLWLCLSSEYLLKNAPKQIKEESLTQEENVTKQLYKDYSLFRNEIFDSIQKNNPDYDKLTLFKKTQKLLDRFLFIFFAEDRLLLPPNSIREIINQWITLRDELDAYTPLYSRFKKYFGYMNTGHQGKKHDIFAYNGGLFAPDDVLDDIKIDDTLLYTHTQKLSDYDFESEVSVNILGHIFEHSLNEIEEIQAELEGVETDKGKSKRKKDGVFYTPKYITKYIVDNTVGKLCEEKKAELEIEEAEYEKGRRGRKKSTLKALVQKLEDYRNWLLELTICDPACGSGAFLNQALEFLINEHRYIDELNAKLLGEAMILSKVESSILENNLFGVDINDESVEIAKLSLWLRTAQKGRKLTTLNNNIKCGNSLIDDVEVEEKKAFSWEKEFPKVFKNGGFDVVIGNPPYGTISNKETKTYFKRKFESFQGNLENYCFFTELFIGLAKRISGQVGLIIPTTWLTIPQFQNLRNVVLSNKINSIVDLPTKVFGDADLDTIIAIITRINKCETVNISKVEIASIESFEASVLNSKLIKQDIWTSNENKVIKLDYDPKIASLVASIRKGNVKLKDLFNVSQGIVPYARQELYKQMDKELADDIVDNRLWHSDFEKTPDFKPELKGEDVTRYYVKWNGTQYVKYGSWLARARTVDFFTSPRVLVREITRGNKLNAGFTGDELYNNPGIINIIQKENIEESELILPLLTLMNSSLIFFYHLTTSPKAKLKTSIPKILIKDCENIPIPSRDNLINSNLKDLANQMMQLTKKSIEQEQKVLKFMVGRFNLEKVTKKLKFWFSIKSSVLLNELKKLKIILTITEQAELIDYVEAQQKEYSNIKIDLEKIDKEIDEIVYKLYGLTKEEIKIVEGSVK